MTYFVLEAVLSLPHDRRECFGYPIAALRYIAPPPYPRYRLRRM